jgi:Flp pilus assembly protein TadG
MWPRRQLRAQDRGAVAVEAALISPILLALVFGIVEFGLVMKDWLATSSSVRAAARVASAEPRYSGFAQDAANQVANEAGTALNMANIRELWVYKADVASGRPVGDTGSFASCSKCVKFQWDSASRSFKQISSTWTFAEQNACQGDPSRDAVGVFVQIRHPAITNMFFNNIDVTEHSVMALEPIPTAKVCK